MKKPSVKQALNQGAASLGADIAEPVAALAMRRRAAELAGNSASESTLVKLERAMGELAALKVAPLLQRAVDCIRAEDADGANAWALKALEIDERNGVAWRLLGIAREKLSDFVSAITCYETALPLLADQGEIANDIGRLAFRLDHKDLAAKLFAHFYQAYPDIADGANNLACVLREQNRYGEAIAVLQDALGKNPDSVLLWNTLGSVLCDQGDQETSITFFTEALRLAPDYAKARYNRGCALLALGRFEEALADCDAAITLTAEPSELSMMHLSRSTILHCLGRTGEAWDDYEARLDPHFAGVTHFMIERPKWTPNAELAGKSLLVMGEQGLGDEVLFANAIPDILQALGPDGKLSIALEPRLIPLFQRSFPTASVGTHATYNVNAHTVRGAPFVKDIESVDLWGAMASFQRRFRRSHADYPNRPSFLVPDEARVEHWRQVLKTAPAGPKVGILWKSMKLSGSRMGAFSPFGEWETLLKTPGVCFINLQYGDCAEEIAQAKADMGVDIWTPPGIDLKNDLDDLAALCCALDLIVGFANATTNIGAACGAKVWLINAVGSWVQLGADNILWYPQTRLFTRQVGQMWGEVMEDVAAALHQVDWDAMERESRLAN